MRPRGSARSALAILLLSLPLAGCGDGPSAASDGGAGGGPSGDAPVDDPASAPRCDAPRSFEIAGTLDGTPYAFTRTVTGVTALQASPPDISKLDVRTDEDGAVVFQLPAPAADGWNALGTSLLTIPQTRFSPLCASNTSTLFRQGDRGTFFLRGLSWGASCTGVAFTGEVKGCWNAAGL